MLTFKVAFLSYLILAGLVWISPKEQRLLSAKLPLNRKLLFTALWPFYLFSRPSGIFLKIITAAVLSLIGSVVFVEATKAKIYSLQENDLKETVCESDLNAGQEIEVFIKKEFADNLEKYFSAMKEAGPEAMIKTVKCPAEAAAAIIHYTIRNGVEVTGDLPNITAIHRKKTPIDCYGAAVIAASMLSDDGYPPYLLSLRTSPRTYFFDIVNSSIHMVYIYRQNNKFGYISLQNSTNPIFCSLNELISDVSKNMKVVYTQYFIFDLSRVAKNFITSNPGITEVEVWCDTDRASWWDSLY